MSRWRSRRSCSAPPPDAVADATLVQRPVYVIAVDVSWTRPTSRFAPVANEAHGPVAVDPAHPVLVAVPAGEVAHDRRRLGRRERHRREGAAVGALLEVIARDAGPGSVAHHDSLTGTVVVPRAVPVTNAPVGASATGFTVSRVIVRRTVAGSVPPLPSDTV